MEPDESCSSESSKILTKSFSSQSLAVSLLLAGFFPEEGGGPPSGHRIAGAPPGSPCSWRGIGEEEVPARKLILQRDQIRTRADTFQPP